ncbi:MAG: TlpA disulfide reductase family protein [Bacteroidota bacterium]
MDPVFAYSMAVAMGVVGGLFFFLLVRTNKRPVPQGLVQWVGTTLSVLLIACALLLVVLAQQLDQRRGAATTGALPLQGGNIGALAEDFTFTQVSDEAPLQIEDYRGQVVLLNFWATWCPPCLEELPALNRLQTTYAANGLVVITISDEPRASVLDFQERRLALDTVSGLVSDPALLPQAYREMLRGRPVTYVIDTDGIIQAIEIGERSYEEFEALVRPHLQRGIAQR